MRQKRYLIPALLCWLVLCVFQEALGGNNGNVPNGPKEKELVLKEAVICEAVKGNTFINRAVVFSKEQGKIFCFSTFDPVLIEIPIFHKWYQRDQLKATAKLTLKPPRWTTFSSWRLKGRDQGPWRVEITDNKGHILKILRFSITE